MTHPPISEAVRLAAEKYSDARERRHIECCCDAFEQCKCSHAPENAALAHLIDVIRSEGPARVRRRDVIEMLAGSVRVNFDYEETGTPIPVVVVRASAIKITDEPTQGDTE